jgi:hypothetical protein
MTLELFAYGHREGDLKACLDAIHRSVGHLAGVILLGAQFFRS